MRIVDSHFHWWPRAVFDDLCSRSTYPRAERDGKGGYRYYRAAGAASLNIWPEWFDLDDQFAHMDSLGHEIDAVGSIGPFSVYFSELEKSGEQIILLLLIIC